MRKLFGLLVFLVLAPLASGETLKERNFTDLGYEGFGVKGASQESCRQIIFSMDLGPAEESHYTYLSLHANFFPTSTGTASISVYLNGGEEAVEELAAKDFKEGWARARLQNAELKEKNELTICMKTSSSTTKIMVREDSKIGTYLAPFFGKNDFTKNTAEWRVTTGNPVKVEVILRNSGSEESPYKIFAQNPSRERPDITILEGKTRDEGILGAGKEVRLEYFIRVDEEGTRGLPNAIAEVENVFGEKISLESNYPEIVVQGFGQKLKPIVLLEKGKIKTLEKVSATILVKNEGPGPQYNVKLKIRESGGLNIAGEKKETIEVIGAKESFGKEFTFSAARPGKYSLSCSLDYLDQNASTVQCSPVEIIVEEPGIGAGILIGVVMLLIGLGIYSYLYFSTREKRPSPPPSA